jgi:hypothetical protein
MAHAPVGSSDGDACRICFEASLPTMQSLAHVGCRVQAARTQSAAEEEEKAPSMVELPDVSATLDESHVCGSGERLAVGLHDCEEDLERLAAATTLAISLSDHGKYAEAEQMQREIHAAQTRVLGAEHPDTLRSAGDLALSLSRQTKYAEAEQMFREVHAVQKRVLGAEHPDTLRTTGDLANCLAADDLALCLSRLSAIARTSQAHELNKQSTGVVFSGLLTWMRSRGRSRSRAR